MSQKTQKCQCGLQTPGSGNGLAEGRGEAKVLLGQGPCTSPSRAGDRPMKPSQSCSHLEEGRAEPLLVILRWFHMRPAFVLATGPLGHLLLLGGLSCHLCLPILLPIFQADPLGFGLCRVTTIRVSCRRFLACILPFVCIQVLVEPFLGGAVPAREGEAPSIGIGKGVLEPMSWLTCSCR